jgi:D-amino-acid dehydrogenase
MNQDKQIIVIGAGIVGISSALTLQREGFKVTLIDRKPAAAETSYGNAGLLATSTSLPLNNPGLWHQLPSIVLGTSHYVNYAMPYLLAHIPRFIYYLSMANETSAMRRGKAIRGLVYASLDVHRQWMREAGIESHLTEHGWLKLYPTEAQFAQAANERRLLRQQQVDIQELEQQDIAELEPDLRFSYARGLLVRDTLGIGNPATLCQSYLDLFLQTGGEFVQQEVTDLTQDAEQQWTLTLTDGVRLQSDRVVLSLGPWSADFLRRLGLKLPILYERGGHRMFDPASDGTLRRPVLDAEGGFVVAPMDGQYRVTCGVYLSDHRAPYRWDQLNRASRIAAERLPVGSPAAAEDWHGTRPSLPDYLPAIGETRLRGLWLNTAQHHVGLTMAPASAQLLARMMRNPEIQRDSPFTPARFNC